MRHSHLIKNKVRHLRMAGYSLGEIYKKTQIPKTTIRTWITDIQLSDKHLNLLKDRVQKALQEGRIKAQKISKEKRIKKEVDLFHKGKKDIGELTPRDLFIAGVALYWAEGFKNKYEHRLGFCNSDPSMIKFYISWLEKCLKISKERIVLRLTLNESYKDRVDKMQNYWAQKLKISLSQFTKPFFQTSKWKKQYNTENYYGVLRVHVRDSLDNLIRIRGWIEGLANHLPFTAC